MRRPQTGSHSMTRPPFTALAVALALGAMPGLASAETRLRSGGAELALGAAAAAHAMPGKKHRHARRGHHRDRNWRKTHSLPRIAMPKETARAFPPPPDMTIRATLTTFEEQLGRNYYSSWVASCEARHPSFDAHTGTYIGSDGSVRRCG